MTELKSPKCSYCDHAMSSHKEEPGFYDVRARRADCQVIGCPCKGYR